MPNFFHGGLSRSCAMGFVWVGMMALSLRASPSVQARQQMADFGSPETFVLDNIEMHLPRYENPIEEERIFRNMEQTVGWTPSNIYEETHDLHFFVDTPFDRLLPSQVDKGKKRRHTKQTGRLKKIVLRKLADWSGKTWKEHMEALGEGESLMEKLRGELEHKIFTETYRGKINPSSGNEKEVAELWLHLTLMNGSVGAYRRAVLCVRKAYSLEVLKERAVSVWGIILREQGKAKDAEKLFRKASELHPSSSLYLYEIAEIHRRAQQGAAAVEYYQRALDLNPDFNAAKEKLAMVQEHDSEAAGDEHWLSWLLMSYMKVYKYGFFVLCSAITTSIVFPTFGGFVTPFVKATLQAVCFRFKIVRDFVGDMDPNTAEFFETASMVLHVHEYGVPITTNVQWTVYFQEHSRTGSLVALEHWTGTKFVLGMRTVKNKKGEILWIGRTHFNDFEVCWVIEKVKGVPKEGNLFQIRRLTEEKKGKGFSSLGLTKDAMDLAKEPIKFIRDDEYIAMQKERKKGKNTGVVVTDDKKEDAGELGRTKSLKVGSGF